MIMKGHTTSHRKYPNRDWEFKAISIRIADDNTKAKQQPPHHDKIPIGALK